MKEIIDDSRYDVKLEASDCRISASILGLLQYLEYHQLDYEVAEDYIRYNSKDIDEKRYLEFVEYKYGEELHHKVVENILLKEEVNEDQTKLLNEKLANKSGESNTIIKKIFN